MWLVGIPAIYTRPLSVPCEAPTTGNLLVGGVLWKSLIRKVRYIPSWCRHAGLLFYGYVIRVEKIDLTNLPGFPKVI